MKIRNDLSIFRQMMISDEFEDISTDLYKFDNKECHFYYDESNNIRKLWLSENDFNAPVDSDFVLGGVMHFGTTYKADVDELKNAIRLQKSAKEMKFKYINQGKMFLDCLAESKVQIFLKWLYHSDLYVHYSNVNNLYWAVVDIIDTIDEPTLGNIHINKFMKNELYKVACSKYNDFYQLLVQNNYPNITIDNIKSFYQGIVDLIESISNEPHFELEYLRQVSKAARKQSDVILLQGNPDKTVIDSYFHFYLRPIGVFYVAQHHFDNENQIEEQFEKYTLLYNGKKVDNYCFVDSVSSPLVQVSDCVVGLLGKYYTYINGITIESARQMLETITGEQKTSLKLFTQILKKSEDLSKLLFCSIECTEEHDVGAYILNNSPYI